MTAGAPAGDAARAATAAAQRAALELRRDALLREVAEGHWHLGGLVYEMAARDHFRMDLILARAARLQESDTELAEVERLLTGSGLAATSAQAPGQLGQGDGTSPVAPPASAGAPAAAVAETAAQAPESPGRFGAKRLWQAMTLAFFVSGVAIGLFSATNASTQAQSAALRLNLGAVRASAPASGANVAAGRGGSGGEASEGSGEAEPATGGAGGGGKHAHKATGASGAAHKGGESAAGGGEAKSGGGESGAGSGKSEGGEKSGSQAKATALPPFKHVFLIVLDEQPYAGLFGPEGKDSYLAKTLEHKGELLVRYYAAAHGALAGEIALISGQGPTAQTAEDCPVYQPIAAASMGADEQLLGQGCVYPAGTASLQSELAAKRLDLRVFAEGAQPVEATGACSHPQAGAADPTAAATSSAPYATYLDPFLYFQAVAGSGHCAGVIEPLSALSRALAREATTPAFSYLTPDRCHDAAVQPCSAGAASGAGNAEAFLKQTVPAILASPAYRKNGLLVITASQAPASGAFADSSACCGQPVFPGIPAAQARGLGGIARGGGQVGALLLSPYLTPAGSEQEPLNAFGLLKSFAAIFGVKAPGYAAAPGVKGLQPSLFTAAPQTHR